MSFTMTLYRLLLSGFISCNCLFAAQAPDPSKDQEGGAQEIQLREVEGRIDEEEVPPPYKPQNPNELTLEEVVSLVQLHDFSYDQKGSYLALLNNVSFDGSFSRECIAYVCNELGCYYKRQGNQRLAIRAFLLEGKYEKVQY